MQLSEKTINLLCNFGSINNNLCIEEGHAVTTMNMAKTIVGYAEVDESFPCKANIYDIVRFMSVLNRLGGDTPELTFEDDKKILIQDKSLNIKSTIWLCDDIMIKNRGKDMSGALPTMDVVLDLGEEQFFKAIQAAETMKLDYVSIVSDGENVKLLVSNRDTESTDTFEIELDVEGDGSVYDFAFSIKNLLIMQGDYRISLSSAKITQFEYLGSDLTLKYWIALDATSTYTAAPEED